MAKKKAEINTPYTDVIIEENEEVKVIERTYNIEMHSIDVNGNRSIIPVGTKQRIIMRKENSNGD